MEYVVEILPEAVQSAFIHAGKEPAMRIKRNRAKMAINRAIGLAVAACATPLPCADAIALVAIQIGMISKITTIYGFKRNKALITAGLSSLLGTTATTIVGRTIATNLIKLIPGVGTAAGIVISSGTAAILTKALGETYCGIMEALLKGEITEEQLKHRKSWEKYTEIFKDKLRKSNPSEDPAQYTLLE